MPQVPEKQQRALAEALAARHNSSIKQQAPKQQALPGVTATVLIPYAQPRAIGGLARKKDGAEITTRVNDLDKVEIAQGAQLCGLKVADYVRQCAVHMAQALKAQANAHPSDGTSPRSVPRQP